MQIRMLCAAAAAALAGCAAQPTVTTTQQVQVPVAVACVETVPPRPALTAEKVWAETSSEFDRQRALRVDRARLLQHVAEQEALLANCARKP